MGFIKVAATDLDGTAVSGDVMSRAVITALKCARRDGLFLILVTGRIGTELFDAFPRIAELFDAMVLENGAVSIIDGRTRLLAPPVESELADALAERGIPHRSGEVLLATAGMHSGVVVDVIAELGLDCQIMHNRAELMILPAGVTKGTGLASVLAEMNLSPRNAIAIGDAENDLSMFDVAEAGVAVANAVPSVRRHADLVLDEHDGAGLAQLLAGPYVTGVRRWCPPRRWIEIGTCDDGTSARVPGSQARIVVTGGSGSGKSYLAGLMAERWIGAGYCVLVIDPEGDHAPLHDLSQVQVVDSRNHLPEPTELVETLLHPQSSVVVDLSALQESAKANYMQALRLAAETHREELGYPHWLVIDEAHLLGSDEEAAWVRRGGYVLSSWQPALLPVAEVDGSDVRIELAGARTDEEIVGDVGRRATIREGSGPAMSFVVSQRRTTHVRHRHKYADVILPADRCFYFRSADSANPVVAGSIHDFRRELAHLNVEVLEYHLERGDFSRWLENTISDKELAAQVAGWENQLQARRAVELEQIRRRVLSAVDERYLRSADRS